MLDDVELVVDDAAVRQPLFDALPERQPHIHAGRLDRAALEGTQMTSEKLIQRLLLALSAKPQRLAGRQVADYGDELLLLAQKDLVDAHLPQGRLASRLGPSLQIALIDGPHPLLVLAFASHHSFRVLALSSISCR